MLQEGACLKCGRPLDGGFHRHHKDGDHANNSEDNLELLCPECHHGEKYSHDKDANDDAVNMLEQHKLVEREVFKGIQEMITAGMDKSLSGANMERIMDGYVKMLQISKREKGLDDVEYPPTEIKIMLSKGLAEEKMNEYLRGIEDGIRMITLKLSPTVVNNSVE